jgi:hypothetical protein
LRHLKQKYAGKRIGLPKNGAGLARGDWNMIKDIFTEELLGDNALVKYDQIVRTVDIRKIRPSESVFSFKEVNGKSSAVKIFPVSRYVNSFTLILLAFAHISLLPVRLK